MSNSVDNRSSRQLPLRLVLERQSTFEHFVVGDNGAAVEAVSGAACNADASWPLLSSEPGLGKTHLLNAACHAADRAGRRAMFFSANTLRRYGPEPLAQTDYVQLMAIDDVDTLIGDPLWDEALFHMINRLRQQAATLILASSTEPAALEPTLPDLRSRLSWGVTFTLRPLDEAHRRLLLKRRARATGIDLSEEVIGYLMRRAPRDVRSLLSALAQLERASLVEKRRITVPFVREQFPQMRTDK